MNTQYFKTDLDISSILINGKQINVQNGLIQVEYGFETILSQHGFRPYHFVEEILEEINEIKPKLTRGKKNG